MNNYKLTIQYDGSRYNGWQRQSDTKNTIQQTINDCIDACINENVKLIGAGRTDAGVHALGQCANFRCERRLNENDFLFKINEKLPEDIKILEIKRVPLDFHARHSAKEKSYVYRIDTGYCGSPFERKYSWRIDGKLNVKRMEEASISFLGTHDFASFCTDADKMDTTVKQINNISFRNTGRNGEILEIEFRAPGFMYNMVRILTGTLVDVGLGRFEPKDMIMMLEKKKRSESGQMALAKGLFLKSVEY